MAKARRTEKKLRKKKTFFNIPNTVTLLRLALLPLLLFFIATGWKYPAFGLFFFIALLDKLDGYLANKLKQGTDFGRGFDAAVDSTTILLVFVFMSLYHYIEWYQFGVLLFFGIISFVIQARFVAMGRNIMHTEFARYTTFFTYVFIGAALTFKETFYHWLVFWLFMLVAVLSFVRTIQYIQDYKKETKGKKTKNRKKARK